MTKNQFNQELTDSFDGIVPLTKGNLQILTDVNDNMYLSFYTHSLLWSCGYNNPTINRDVNQLIKESQSLNKPIDLPKLLSDLSEQFRPYLPKKLTTMYFESQNLYPRILSALLSKRNKTEFLCLEKNAGTFPEDFENQIFSFKDFLHEDPKANPDILHHGVFPELKTIKFILKKHKNTLAGCIINPLLSRDASIAKKELLEPLLALLKKYNIPIIWDESMTGLYRMGPSFSHQFYDIDPDVLLYNGSLYNDRFVHFACLTKRINKRCTDNESHINAKDIPNYIMLKALIRFMESSELTKKIQSLGTRMIGKLRALEANSGRKFTIKGKGLTLFINFKSEETCDAFVAFMKTKGILVKKFTPRPSFVFIYPPLILTEKNIDEIVENFKKFFDLSA